MGPEGTASLKYTIFKKTRNIFHSSEFQKYTIFKIEFTFIGKMPNFFAFLEYL